MSSGEGEEHAWVCWCHRVLQKRGWRLHAQDARALDAQGVPTSAQPSWVYPASFGGQLPQPIGDIAPQPAECFLAVRAGQTLDGLLVVHAGNEAACPAHTRGEQWLGLPSLPRELAGMLEQAERHARGRDPRELLECRFFGPCGVGWDPTGARRD